MTLRTDSQFSTGSGGLTNARTRIVGTRTGFLADAIVEVVRIAQSIQSRLGRITARARDVVTPLGWAMLVFVPVGLILGYSLGWLELIVAAWAGLVILGVALIYLIGQSPLQVALLIPRLRTVVGEPVSGELVVGNPGRLPTVAVTLEVPIGDGLVEVVVPGISPKGESVQDITIPAKHRGVVTVGPVRTVRSDPLGLVRRERIWTAENELFIHPRTIGIASMSTGFVRDLEGSSTRDLTTSDISFHALREYMPGDERRNIHWKSTAKTGRYMVRQFEETRRSHLVVALSLASSDYANDEEFELAVSVAGSLGARAIRDTRDVSVIVSERTPEFAKRKVFAIRELSTLSRNRLLDELSFVEKKETALTLLDISRVAGHKIPGVSVAFVICGSLTSVQDLRAASTKFPLGVEVVAVVCDLDSMPGLRQVSGLSVLTIGYLEDLKKSLLRATT